MLRNKLIIIPIDEIWDHTADFLRQTALTLSIQNKIIIYDQKNACFFLKKIKPISYPTYKNIIFHQVKYFWPFRKFAFIEKLNRKFSLWCLLQKYKNLEKILWIFYPNYFDLAKIKDKKTVSIYDCVDYNKFQDKEKKLITNVDYFFVNSLALKGLHNKAPKKPIYIDSQGFFIPDEKKIKKVNLKTKKPVIGYVGGINYRLDFSLLDKLIKNNQQWQFIFYGPEQKYPKEDIFFKTKLWIKKIKKYNNVTFGESKDRHEVYSIIKNFDIAIIPYNKDAEFNKYCYPMKVFEYFYFSKPVISTNIGELKSNKFKELIKIAETYQDFEAAIKNNLQKKLPVNQSKKMKNMAFQNSWEQKIEKISKLIFSD